MKKAEGMLALDESNGFSHDTEGDEVIVLIRSSRDGHDLSGRLIENFGRGEDRAVGIGLELAQQTLGACGVDVETKNSASEMPV